MDPLGVGCGWRPRWCQEEERGEEENVIASEKNKLVSRLGFSYDTHTRFWRNNESCFELHLNRFYWCSRVYLCQRGVNQPLYVSMNIELRRQYASSQVLECVCFFFSYVFDSNWCVGINQIDLMNTKFSSLEIKTSQSEPVSETLKNEILLYE